MRGFTIALLVLLLNAAAYGQNKVVQQPADPKINDDAKAALQKRLPELRFDNVGFADVVDFLRDVTGANIFVNWKKLEAAGIDRNVPVTARLRDIPFEKALNIILDSISDKTKVAFIVDEGVITISTAEDLQQDVVQTTYDVRPLAAMRKTAGDKDALIAMITGSIAPGTWGKGKCKIEDSPDGQLIVTTTEANQKLIANLIENLKRMAK